MKGPVRPNPPPSLSDDVPTEDEVNKESTEEPKEPIKNLLMK